MLIADEFTFQKWQAEVESTPEVGANKSTSRPWDAKKVYLHIVLMKNVFLSTEIKGSCCGDNNA